MRIFIAATIITLIFAGCSGNPQAERRALLIGTWKEVRSDGKNSALTLLSNGTGNEQTETGSWGILEPKLIILSFDWNLEQDSLFLKINHSTASTETLSGTTLSLRVVELTKNNLKIQVGSNKIDSYIKAL